MKTPKIISFIAFISHSSFTVYAFFTFLKFRPIFQELGGQIPFLWPLLITAAFAIGSLAYWFYLRNKEKKGETVRFALWVSIALLLIPWLFFYSLTIISMLQPIYLLMKAIK